MNTEPIDRQFAWRFVLLFCFTLALATWTSTHPPMPSMGSAQTQKQAYLFTQAEVLFSADASLTAAMISETEGGRISVPLPDSWDRTQPDFEGQGWYEIRFQTRPDKPRPSAVFIPRAVMNAHAYINGHWVGGQGAMTGELPRKWNHPYLFQFSSELLNEGENTLLIQVAGYKNYRSGLGRVWLGPSEVLEPLYYSSHRWQVTGSMIATLVAFGSGLLMFLFTRVYEEKEGLIYLSLAIVIFAIRNTGYFLDWAPLPHQLWGQLIHSMHAWFACLYGLFLIRYMGIDWKWVPRLLVAYASTVTVLTVLIGGEAILHFTFLLLMPVVPGLLVLTLLVLGYSWRTQSFEAGILGCSSLLFVLLSIRDLATMIDLLPVESILLSQYTGLLLFMSAVWIIFRRYRFMLLALENANDSLNTELGIREQQLFRQFNLLRKVEQQRAQDNERRRIMQDIHDGVGSSLVSALNLSETRVLTQDEMRDVLQECLDDLRMAIDSLDPQSNDLLALLGNFRWRYERRLKASGVSLVWSVADIPNLEGYSSRDLFDLLRIVQEAFANSLKHAKPTRIELSVRMDDTNDKVMLNIVDNGSGLPSNTLGSGRGMAHMKIRAKSIRIDLHIDNNPAGQGVAVYMGIPRLRSK